ncbi:MAG: nucleotide exchange factor GrpE [Candidatus Latescibacterota bacterium]|nr:MAG: nucleotide exchange factor GrpE [Candidatus Latescibacterota bacterium]
MSEEEKKEGGREQEAVEKDELTKLKEELEQAKAEAAENYDKWLRAVAELDNYRKRTARQMEALVRTATEDLVVQLLPVLDDFERALDHTSEGEEVGKAFVDGVRMIYEKFRRVIEGQGVCAIGEVGEKFDPEYHEALMQVENPEHPPGTVAQVVQKGYKMGDKVIRHAKVIVSKGKEATEK